MSARVALFRAVTFQELSDIEALACFANPPGIEVKYFATTRAGAKLYAGLAQAAFADGPYRIVSTTLPEAVFSRTARVRVDGGIETVAIPTKMLVQLARPVLEEE